MSRDTKTSYTDCQGHGASAVPFASPFPVDANRDKLSEPERSVRPVSSFVATTCASDTDEGDYETSSEGMILSKRSGTGIHGARAKESLYLKEKSASLSKRAAFNGNLSAIKSEVISDPPHELVENRLTQKTTYIRDGLIPMSENLAQSKSLPILKSEIPSGVSTDFTAADVALTSTSSSSAHKRKMSIIIKKMAPLISPYPSTISLTTGATTNFRGRHRETKRLASRTMLLIPCDTTVINDRRSEERVTEVTLYETKNNRRVMNWDPRRDAIPTFVNDEGAANVTNDDNDDDLLDVAKNPHSSIKSVFFPPNFSDSVALPYDSGKSKRHQRRVSTDVETLLKIDNELSPLRFQYSEIIGKARALGLDGSGFDLDISRRLNRPDTFGQSVLSPSASNYFSDRNLTYLRRAAISSGIENRSALVDKTSPSSTFSVVGKPTPRGSRTSWLNENGSSCRQEALSFAIRDPSRTLENFDGPRSFSRVRNSVSYFPTTNSHTSRGENVLNDRSRNGCVSNSNFQSYRKSKTVMERATSAFVDQFAYETINADPLKFFNKTQYNSHLYLNKTTEDSRISIDNSFGIQRLKSSVSTHIVIDNNWSAMDKGTANKRPNEHFEIPSGNQNSTEFASRSGDHKSTSPEIERVVKDDRIFSPLDLKSIDPDVINSNHGTLRTGSASTCVPQIRVVSVNTEFRTTVEKRYTNRAISPIRHPRSTTISPTLTSLSNVLLATKVSSILVQQVRADSSRKMAKIEPPTKMCSIDARCVRKRNVFVDATSKRDFCAQKVDSRLAAENPSRLIEFKNDEANLTTKFRKAQCVCLPRTKEMITIVPIVLTDGTSGSPRTANVDVAVPRRAVKTVPKVSYQPARFDARKFRGTSSLSIRDNEGYRRAITNSLCSTEQLMDERGWRADRTSVSRGNRHLCAEEDYSPSTTTNVAENPKRPIRVTTSKARGVRQTREDRESGRPGVARTLPGMRSTPEDFLCET